MSFWIVVSSQCRRSAWSVLFGAAVTAALTTAPARADPALPVPSANFVTAGSASSPVVSGSTMTINQHTSRATMNWESFNIGAGGTVNFQQPSSDSIALNQIHQADPVKIQGALNANGEVWLLNQNRLSSGNGAQVNVRGLVTSTLNQTPDAIAKGIAPQAGLGYDGPAFAADIKSGDILVEDGANIQTNGPNGHVFLLRPMSPIAARSRRRMVKPHLPQATRSSAVQHWRRQWTDCRSG
ncbi:MAG: filamentous hemagglutinin N-terminal domain-containing protein [Gammaproteobacteria bacterium]